MAADHDPELESADTHLLRRHVDGDPDAFGALFVRHRDRLWAVALRTLGDPDDAADALQEAMLSAFRRAESFRGDAAVTTWLHRIVVNACLDQVRRKKVRATEPLPDDGDHLAELAAPEDTDAADRMTEQDTVLSAMRTLAPEQRQALVLVDMEGYSVAEAAEMLGCAVGTVKSRCARGRARLLPLVRHLRNPDGAAHVQPVDAPNPAPGGDVA
ncbi:MAG: RNA polymerase sigma factor SigM [Nocardioidaceae bacterium]